MMNIFKENMLTKILFIVIIGILSTVLVVSSIIINISKDIFIDTYVKAQQQSFSLIQNELNSHHENLINIFNQINSSVNIKLFLKQAYNTEQSEAKIVYKAEDDMNKIKTDDIRILLLSTQGKTYLGKQDILNIDESQILNMSEVQKAIKNPEIIQYVYKDTGFTVDTRNKPVILCIKALKFSQDSEVYGVGIAIITEKDFSKYYEYFNSEYTKFYFVNSNNIIISSSDKSIIGQEMQHTYNTINLTSDFPFYNCTAYGVIESQNALSNLYNEPSMWVICFIICIIVCVMIGYIVKKTFDPLSDLIFQMSHARKNKYNQYITPKGSKEIQELSKTYNTMLSELNHYINELLNMQDEKRKAEIEALQMQINPHYIYNTLASIKWLIYQGNVEKSTKTIDAFIGLLRNTIGNTDETVSVSKEIENLKNYVLINNTRYGDKVKVDYFVAFGCEDYKIPKMMLQPFIENAFFHAFPYDMNGNIKIFVKKVNQKLKIQIIDNGIGIQDSNSLTKTEHFTGIGMNNVNTRLKLLYGEEYGIKINSKPNQGTTITIIIPI